MSGDKLLGDIGGGSSTIYEIMNSYWLLIEEDKIDRNEKMGRGVERRISSKYAVRRRHGMKGIVTH